MRLTQITVPLISVVLGLAGLAPAQQPAPIPTSATVQVYDVTDTTAAPTGTRAGELLTELVGYVCHRTPDEAPVSTLNPQHLEFTDPISGPPWVCSVPLPTVPSGRVYRASVYLTAPHCEVGGKDVGPCDSDLVYASTAFEISAPDPCLIDHTRPADLRVGDWTRSGRPGDSGRVTYSLQFSTVPVITVITRLAGVEQGRLAGEDLRAVAGSYFTLPMSPGSYPLTVSALTIAGCEDSVTRPMTVVVLP